MFYFIFLSIVSVVLLSAPCCECLQLSKYCDGLLRKTARTLSDVELEEKFNNIITIFGYIEDKDVFQRVSIGCSLKCLGNMLLFLLLMSLNNPEQTSGKYHMLVRLVHHLENWMHCKVISSHLLLGSLSYGHYFCVYIIWYVYCVLTASSICHTHTHTSVLLLFWNMSRTTRVSRYLSQLCIIFSFYLCVICIYK